MSNEFKVSGAIEDQMRDPKSSEGGFELPCGWLSPDGVIHTDVVLKEITGAEEDMLASRSINGAKKITELLSRCIVRLGPVTDRGSLVEAVRDLPVGDRVYLMFAVRRVSLGDTYPFLARCPKCDEENFFNMDLGDLEVKKMADPARRVFDITLPSGKPARFKVLTGRDEERLAKISDDGDALSLSILVRLEMLDGKPANMKDVKDLGMRDRNALRDQFEEVEGGVDTDMTVGCPSCGRDFTKGVDIGQSGFFFPSAVQKRSKKNAITS